MDEEQMLTRRQAANLAGVHYNTVRLWEKRGKVTTHRVSEGGVEEVRIPRSEVEALIALRPPPEGDEERVLLERIISDLRDRLEEAERERKLLLDRLLECKGITPTRTPAD